MPTSQGAAGFSGAGGFFASTRARVSAGFNRLAGAGSLETSTNQLLLGRISFAALGSFVPRVLAIEATSVRFSGAGVLGALATRLTTSARFSGAGVMRVTAWTRVPKTVAFQAGAFQTDAFQVAENLRTPDSIRVGSPRFGAVTISPQHWTALGDLTLTGTIASVVQITRGPTLGNLALDATIKVTPPQYITVREFDRHLRRAGDDYAEALIHLFPNGIAWPKWNRDSVFMKTVRGLGQYWGFVDGRAADLLERESDPRKTIELLTDWERNFGLPEECFSEPQSIAERQRMLVWKMTLLGAQSRAWFIYAADLLHYSIRITEYAPFMFGVSNCGDTRDRWMDPHWEIGPPEIRFYWTVHAADAKLTWFRADASQFGVDPHLRIGIFTDLECLLRKWKPAHTDIVFDYSSLTIGGPMAGTP